MVCWWSAGPYVAGVVCYLGRPQGTPTPSSTEGAALTLGLPRQVWPLHTAPTCCRPCPLPHLQRARWDSSLGTRGPLAATQTAQHWLPTHDVHSSLPGAGLEKGPVPGMAGVARTHPHENLDGTGLVIVRALGARVGQAGGTGRQAARSQGRCLGAGLDDSSASASGSPNAHAGSPVPCCPACPSMPPPSSHGPALPGLALAVSPSALLPRSLGTSML